MDERDREYCQQALMDGEKALAYYGQAGRQWAQNEMAADAIAKRIESFCEYVDRISLAERARRPGFPWQEIRGMRNRLAHAYHHIDVRIIQELLDVYLPRDLAAMRAWLAEDSSFMVAAASEKAEQVITARTRVARICSLGR